MKQLLIFAILALSGCAAGNSYFGRADTASASYNPPGYPEFTDPSSVQLMGYGGRASDAGRDVQSGKPATVAPGQQDQNRAIQPREGTEQSGTSGEVQKQR